MVRKANDVRGVRFPTLSEGLVRPEIFEPNLRCIVQPERGMLFWKAQPDLLNMSPQFRAFEKCTQEINHLRGGQILLDALRGLQTKDTASYNRCI